MQKMKIKCYLCGNDAIEEDGYRELLSVIVTCPKCTKYEATFKSIRFYLKIESGEEILNKTHREKLSEFVKEYYDEKGEPVLLNPETIQRETGVESVHIRFKN